MLKLTIKTSERRHWCRSGVFIVNFEHISHLVLVFLLLTLSRQMPTGSASLQANTYFQYFYPLFFVIFAFSADPRKNNSRKVAMNINLSGKIDRETSNLF